MRRLAIAVALMAALFLAVPSSTAAWSAGTYDYAAGSRLAYLINGEHKRVCGSSIAVRSWELTNAARWRSKDMVTRDYFSHTILGTTQKVWDRFGSFGINEWKGAGEDIGWNNYPDDLSADAVFRAFMASPGHRALIQACAYNAFGVGTYKGADGRKMYSVEFTVQPVERVRVSGYPIKSGPYSSTTTLFRVAYGTRMYVFRHVYNRYGNRWDYGKFAGHGWGWAYDKRTW